MSKIESRAVDLDVLPPWDDSAETASEEAQSPSDRALAAYTLDSEQRTLVGIGPLERARRSRAAAAAAAAASAATASVTPTSHPLPPSEPPGPFIADDDEELVALRPRRRLGKRALGVAGAVLVPLAIMGVVRAFSTDTAPSSAPPRAAAALPATPAPQPPEPSKAARPADVPEANVREESATTSRTDDANGQERAKERAPSPPAPERASADALPPPPPVKLAELPVAPAVVDRAGSTASAGTLNVSSTPPASVVLDGRPVGKSPRVVRVPAGNHTVVFIHPLYGRRSLNVNVRSGATASAATEF